MRVFRELQKLVSLSKQKFQISELFKLMPMKQNKLTEIL